MILCEILCTTAHPVQPNMGVGEWGSGGVDESVSQSAEQGVDKNGITMSWQ